MLKLYLLSLLGSVRVFIWSEKGKPDDSDDENEI